MEERSSAVIVSYTSGKLFQLLLRTEMLFTMRGYRQLCPFLPLTLASLTRRFTANLVIFAYVSWVPVTLLAFFQFDCILQPTEHRGFYSEKCTCFSELSALELFSSALTPVSPEVVARATDGSPRLFTVV